MISLQIIEAIVRTANECDLVNIQEQIVGERRIREAMKAKMVEGHNITWLEREMLLRKNKVEAVRLYRDRVRCNLLEAKTAIDNFENVLNNWKPMDFDQMADLARCYPDGIPNNVPTTRAK